eukprot:4000635-Amphidinium_carterae.1
MSDAESCFEGLQQGSDMQVCDAAVYTGENAEMDNSDPLGLMQSQSPPSQRRSRRARSSPQLREGIRSVSCERGESEAIVDRSPLPRRQVPPPPPAPIYGSCSTPPIEKQMPGPLGRRVIAPQPPPPPMVKTIPAHPQPPQQQAVALQMMGIPPNVTQQSPHSKIVKQTSPQQEDIASGPAQHKRNIELVYHGRFAPFHLGHLAVVEAAVTLIKVAMRPEL